MCISIYISQILCHTKIQFCIFSKIIKENGQNHNSGSKNSENQNNDTVL